MSKTVSYEDNLTSKSDKEITGEFLGRLVLGVEDNLVKVYGATIY